MQIDGTLHGNARTYSTHIFGLGLEDDRYVVERFVSPFDGEIKPYARARGGRKVNEPDRWADLAVATPIVDWVPWGAAVRREDRRGRLGKMLSVAIVDWHKSGFLIALERKWGIPATRWPVEMRGKCLDGHDACNDLYDPGE